MHIGTKKGTIYLGWWGDKEKNSAMKYSNPKFTYFKSLDSQLVASFKTPLPLIVTLPDKT